jgi:transposase
MAAIVHQFDKRSGITYAYESISFWDKNKKQSRCKRTLIGRVDAKTGKITPTKKKREVNNSSPREGCTSTVITNRSFYGATYLFDEIGKHLGITTDLKQCFPNTYKQILSIAYYLIMEDKNPLSRFPKWANIHKHPYGKDIPSQRSSEIFASITEESKENFFKLQGKRRVEKEYWAYDTTSISSYSESLKQVKYGKNKDDDDLPQINLALLFGEESMLPFYYRKLPGNITDVMIVKNLLADMNFLGYNKIKLVMDRGFYSESNINGLYQNHYKFLIATKTSLKFIKNELDKVISSLSTWPNYIDKYELYGTMIPITWNYSQRRPNKGDTTKKQRRMYLHLYYNSEKALEDEKAFNRRLSSLQTELETNKTVAEHQKQYEKYFHIKKTPKRGTKVTAKVEIIAEAKRYYGYFALLSNEVKEPIMALEIYRNKDVVEKAFGDLKERLNLRRANVSSEQCLDGKIFVEFIALIYLSYIKKCMQEKNLFKNYTMQEVIDNLDVIECFEQEGKKSIISEITEKQSNLFEALGITTPTSL